MNDTTLQATNESLAAENAQLQLQIERIRQETADALNGLLMPEIDEWHEAFNAGIKAAIRLQGAGQPQHLPASAAHGADEREAAYHLIRGIREFYFGYLHEHLPYDVVDSARKISTTDLVFTINASRFAAPAAPAIPEGHAIVPIEPTGVMMDAGTRAAWKAEDGGMSFYPMACYRAMVAAAPIPASPKQTKEGK